MGLFDFFKKKELTEITSLKEEISDLKKHVQTLSKYQGIVDVDAQIAQKMKECDDKIAKKKESFSLEESRRNLKIDNLNKQIEDLDKRYQEGFEVYQKLRKEIDIYTDTLNMAEFGVYDPHFNFDDSEQYKAEIIAIREEQKQIIKNGEAVIGGELISWNGSHSKGQAMVKRQKQLMLRAFNGECDSFISDVEWNNVLKMEERIDKSFNAINKVYHEQGVHISHLYMTSKKKELQLAFEYKDKKHKEREEQRAIREQMREEEKARREIETAIEKAQKEEETYQKALSKAREEILHLEGEKQEKMQQRITELEARIAEAEQNKERALSMAQQTKRGHVYVISNIGSFGKNVYKIGMTRRLDPIDRVRELGDASVPFPFDVHAMIFSENAPALEAELHKQFENKRVNKVNPKKEFFNVSLSEIEEVVHKNNATIEFTEVAEARDFRESKVIESQFNDSREKNEEFAPNLFDNK